MGGYWLIKEDVLLKTKLAIQIDDKLNRDEILRNIDRMVTITRSNMPSVLRSPGSIQLKPSPPHTSQSSK